MRGEQQGSLLLTLVSADVAQAGTRKIVVTNPTPGGGSSEPKDLSVS
jgi:hypothetical protein